MEIWRYADNITSNDNISSAQLDGRHKVIQYNMEGVFIRQYETIAEASLNNNLNPRQITQVCKGEQIEAGGYQWRYADPTITIEHKRKVIQCDLQGKPLKEYESLSKAASETKININGICSACKGKQKTSGGYKWMYSNP